ARHRGPHRRSPLRLAAVLLQPRRRQLRHHRRRVLRAIGGERPLPTRLPRRLLLRRPLRGVDPARQPGHRPDVAVRRRHRQPGRPRRRRGGQPLLRGLWRGADSPGQLRRRLIRSIVARMRNLTRAGLLVAVCLCAWTPAFADSAPAAPAAAEPLAADTPKTTTAGHGFIAPLGWTVRVKGPATILESPEGESWIAFVDVPEAKDAEAAVAAGWAAYKPD